jgi:hypothetical protein
MALAMIEDHAVDDLTAGQGFATKDAGGADHDIRLNPDV